MPLSDYQYQNHNRFLPASLAYGGCGNPGYDDETQYNIAAVRLGHLSPPDIGSKEEVMSGERIEAYIDSLVKEFTGAKTRCISKSRSYFHPDFPFLVAHPDRLWYQSCGWEYKNTSEYAKDWDKVGGIKLFELNPGEFNVDFGEDMNDAVPERTLYQCQQTMACVGWDRQFVCALIGGNKPRIYPIRRDDRFIRNMIVILAKLWENIQDGILPAPSNRNDINNKYPEVHTEKIVVNEEINIALEAMARARRDVAGSESVLQEAIVAVQDLIGDAGLLVDSNDNKLVSFKMTKKGRQFRPNWEVL